MATCDTEALMQAAACLDGLEGRDLEVLKAQLLCEIYSTASEEPPTLWEDLRVSTTSTKLGGSKDPNWAQFATNGSGSRGVYTYSFNHIVENEVFFNVQLPHGWVEGTDIYWHVHWSASTSSNIGTIVWGLEYTWSNIGSVFPNTTIVGVADGVDFPGGSLKKHMMTSGVKINASGKTASSMILCRMFRDLTNSTGAGNNTLLESIFLLENDFHYQCNACGGEL